MHAKRWVAFFFCEIVMKILTGGAKGTESAACVSARRNALTLAAAPLLSSASEEKRPSSYRRSRRCVVFWTFCIPACCTLRTRNGTNDWLNEQLCRSFSPSIDKITALPFKSSTSGADKGQPEGATVFSVRRSGLHLHMEIKRYWSCLRPWN